MNRVLGVGLVDGVNNDEFRKGRWDTKYGASDGSISIEEVIQYIADSIAKSYSDSEWIQVLERLWEFDPNILGMLKPSIYATESKSIMAMMSSLFYDFMISGQFLPGGRILAAMSMFYQNAGKRKNVTLQNCYSIPIKDDSITGIMDCAKEMAISYSWGGGVGTDISGLRYNGAEVSNASHTSTGSVSFMELYDVVTKLIGQRGRRGALLISLHVSHPDIMQFIRAKANPLELQNMNISVKVNREFMETLENDGDWELKFPKETIGMPYERYKHVQYLSQCFDHPQNDKFYVKENNKFYKMEVVDTVKAKNIWEALCDQAWRTGDPGIQYWDLMKDGCPYEYTGEELYSTNPCGEEPLSAYNVCNLGAINLSKVGTLTKRNDGENYFTVKNATALGVMFLDAALEFAIDNQLFPLQQQLKAVKDLRLVGLGITGIADRFLLEGIRYGSDESIQELERVMSEKRDIELKTSIALGRALGSYKYFDRTEFYKNSPIVDELPEIPSGKLEMRNAQLSTVAPTGTISIIMGCSTGLEPVFDYGYTKRVLNKETNEYEDHVVEHPFYSDYKDSISDEILVTAHDITPEERLKIQEVCQKYTDGSLSSTVNMAEHTTTDDVSYIYKEAYKRKCKGITVFRDNCEKIGILLRGVEPTKSEPVSATLEEKASFQRNDDNINILPGRTIQIPFDKSWYVTVNYMMENAAEIFINAGKSGSDIKAWTEAIGRVTSMYLQEGGSIQEVIKSLKGIMGEKTVMKKGWMIHSGPDAVAKAIEHIENMMKGDDELPEKDCIYCPACGELTYKPINGCWYCQNTDCAYSSCE